MPAFFLAAFLAQHQPDAAAEAERLQLARQRAAMQHALRQIQAVEIDDLGGPGGEGLHAHHILALADRALGTKHRCYVPKELLERAR